MSEVDGLMSDFFFLFESEVYTRRLIYVIFMFQQSLEKCFKAFLVYTNKEIIPIHNLRRLADLASIIREGVICFVEEEFDRDGGALIRKIKEEGIRLI